MNQKSMSRNDPAERMGMMPSLIELGPGCRFQSRCERADATCYDEPEARTVGGPHEVCCHHPIADAGLPADLSPPAASGEAPCQRP